MNDAAMGLSGIDQVIVAIYMLGILVIGTYFGRYVKTSKDFFIAGKSLPFWAIGMSIVVSDIGATDFIAAAGGSYQYGLAQANFDWIGSVPALIIAAFIFIPYYWRAGVYTIPEFLERRYNVAVRSIAGVLWGVFLVMNLAIMLYATALLLKTLMGWNAFFSISITTAVVGIYTIMGGLSAVVMTDVLQLVIMFVGGGALVWRSMYEVGGWGALREGIMGMGPAYQDHLTLFLPHDTTTPFPWTGIVLGLGIVLATAYFAGNQAIVQRTLGARTEWDAKAGALFASLLKLMIPLLVVLPGLAALLIAPGLDEPDQAVPQLIKMLLPPGLRGLMFAAFLAALMSSVDSNLNSAATIWTEDILFRMSRILGSPISERHGLFFGRLLAGALLIASAVIAPAIEKFTTIYVAIQTMMSMFQGPMLAILLLGILWRRTTQWGALVALVLGVALSFFLNFSEGIFSQDDPFLFVAWWSFVFSMIVTVVVSLMTPPEPLEKIRGLVFGLVLADEETQQALKERIPG